MKTQNKKHNTSSRPRHIRVNTYTEFFHLYKNGDTNATCYADVVKENALHAERCDCGNPYKCYCTSYNPPSPEAIQTMEMSLFKHSMPFLLYTITKGQEADCKHIFVCKIEQEVIDEIFRLNNIHKSVIMWEYKEEEEYNERAKADHQDFLLQQSEYERLL